MMVESGTALVLTSLIVIIWARHPAMATRATSRTALRKIFIVLFLLNYTRCQHCAIAVVMQLEREDQDVPVPAAFFLGQVRQATEAAVDVGLTRIGHGADNVFPLGAEFGKFLKTVFAGKPRAL